MSLYRWPDEKKETYLRIKILEERSTMSLLVREKEMPKLLVGVLNDAPCVSITGSKSGKFNT